MQLPIIVHHMAALDGQYPPNSLEAIRACLDANAAFIEVDITALANADYLLVHDSELESETTGHGTVGECPADTEQEFYFKGSDGQATAYRVPRLSEVVEAFRQSANATHLQLDFKNVLPFADDEPLHRLAQIIQPLGNQVIVSSGADWQLRRLRKIAPWLELGFDIHFYIDWRNSNEMVDPRIPPYRQGAYGYWDDHPLAIQPFYRTPDYLADRCAALTGLVPGVTTFYIEHRLLAQSLDDGFNWAAELHQFGIKLDTWTVDADNPFAVANAHRLLDAGVDLFTTNTPIALANKLKSGG